MDLVVGLGNPGGRYARTRHNVGFMVVDRLAGCGRWSGRADAQCDLASCELACREVLLVKPQTFMNRSGVAVAALHRRLGFAPADVLVLLDDFLLDFGRLRFRRKGSDGGHNGLASVLENMGTQDIPRLRLGIGSPEPGEDPIDHVLSRFGADEPVEELVDRGCQAIAAYLEDGIELAMNRFNSG